MKNFSEATVIKSELKVSMSLTLEPIGKVPCVVQINNSIVFENILTDTIILNRDLGLEDTIDINIQIHRHHPDAVIVSLIVENKEILPKYQHLAEPPTNYLDQSGTWTFRISNFYPWFHKITGQGWII